MNINCLQELIEEFNFAIKHEFSYIAVAIKLPNCEEEELIINTNKNFKAKLEYYKNAYNENLKLKNNEEIHITKCWSFNSYLSMYDGIKETEIIAK